PRTAHTIETRRRHRGPSAPTSIHAGPPESGRTIAGPARRLAGERSVAAIGDERPAPAGGPGPLSGRAGRRGRRAHRPLARADVATHHVVVGRPGQHERGTRT